MEKAVRPGASRFVAVLAAVALVFAATACEPTRAEDRTRPVIFVHGWSGGGNGHDCGSVFGALERNLTGRGFTGGMVTIAYYDSDRNCDVDLRNWGSISNGTSWRDLSKALSRYIYDTYTRKGIAVDLVGHSMGGLIVRGAVYGSGSRQAGWSAPIDVEDAVTVAAPHDGAAWYSSFCLWGQCAGLKPGAADIGWLQQDGNPQGRNGTEWTVIGSASDSVVPLDSALLMSVPAERKVSYQNLGHSDYHGNSTAQTRIAAALARPGS